MPFYHFPYIFGPVYQTIFCCIIPFRSSKYVSLFQTLLMVILIISFKMFMLYYLHFN